VRANPVPVADDAATFRGHGGTELFGGSGMAGNRQKVEAAINGIRKAWALGRKIRAGCGMRAGRGERLIVRMAGRHHIGEDLARKLRQIADPQAGYGRQELERLLRLCRRHGRPLGISHLSKFVTIGDKRMRAGFQREAIRGGWSRARIQAELLRRFGYRRRGGRRRRITDDPEVLLMGLVALCNTWRRWCGQLAEHQERVAGEGGAGPKLNASIQHGLGEVDAAVARLQEAVQADLGLKGRAETELLNSQA
jgi:hypothetical protein